MYLEKSDFMKVQKKKRKDKEVYDSEPSYGKKENLPHFEGGTPAFGCTLLHSSRCLGSNWGNKFVRLQLFLHTTFCTETLEINFGGVTAVCNHGNDSQRFLEQREREENRRRKVRGGKSPVT